MSTKSHLHLAVALDGAGWHPGSWREPNARAGELLSADRWLGLVETAEHGLLDLVTIEDSHRLHHAFSDDALEPRTDSVRGRLDAIVRAAWLGPRTSRIGLVPAAATTISEPFLLSTQIATLDFVSHGRAGWLVQVPDLPGDGGYVGPRPIATAENAWAEATEHVEIVRRLWDSWDDDAEIREPQTNRFFDRDRVHHIDFSGEHLNVKGPSITPRPPQGQPEVAIAIGAAATAVELEFAASAADIVFIRAFDETGLAVGYDRVTAAIATAGRGRGDVRVFADVAVLLDSDIATAAARRARLDGAAGETKPVKSLMFTGTPAGLADGLVSWHEQLGYDGFRLWPASLPHDLNVISEALTAELRQRDRFRTGYESSTLRGLLGFSRPPSPRRDDVGIAAAGGA